MKTKGMTAQEMVLQYWGYDADQDPHNLSENLQSGLKSTVLLMHEWAEKVEKSFFETIANNEMNLQSLSDELDETKQKLFGAQLEISKMGTELAFKEQEISELKNELSEWKQMYYNRQR